MEASKEYGGRKGERKGSMKYEGGRERRRKGRGKRNQNGKHSLFFIRMGEI
jgi:hypothetical protein